MVLPLTYELPCCDYPISFLYVSFVLALVFAMTLLVLLVCFVLCVIPGGSQVRGSNPSRDTSSKRLRNQEAPEGSNAQQRN